MNIDLNDAIVRLNPDNNFQMRNARGACVHVHWGDLWITQEGDQKDHIVKSGESFAISNSGITLLAAMNEVGVSVMKKCRDSALATADYVETIARAAARNEAEARTGVTDASVDDSHRLDSKLARELPGTDALDANIARAEQLRARYLGDIASRGWNALRRILGTIREFG